MTAPDFSGLHYYAPAWIQRTSEILRVNVCVYGGTSAGVIAAIKIARLGKSVIVLQPGQHLGGLTTSGLGCTDYGKQHVIGGLARQFYRAVGRESGTAEEWHFAPSAAAIICAPKHTPSVGRSSANR